MANFVTTTRTAANEDASTYIPSPISTLFERLLLVLAEVIECNRDLADIDIWDTACSGWLKATELAEERLGALVHDLLNADVVRPADRPLRLAAFMLHLTMDAAGPKEVARFAAIARLKAEDFLLTDETATHRHVNAMTRSALALFEGFVALDLCGHDPCADLAASI